MSKYKRTGYFRRRNILRGANFLDLTPLQQYDFRIEDDGMVTVLIPKFSGWLSSRVLQPFVKHPHIALSLDELGTATWMLCNGQYRVKTICDLLKKQFGPKIQPAEERITGFLSQLYKDNIIIFKEVIQQDKHA